VQSLTVKSGTRWAVAITVLALTTVLVCGAGSAVASPTVKHHRYSPFGVLPVVGTWQIEAQPSGGVPPFEVMASFAVGGGLVATESESASTNIGAYAAGPSGDVLVTAHRYRLDAQGQPAGKIILRADLKVRGNTISGMFKIDVYDTGGHIVLSSSGMAAGRRFAVQPL